MKVGTSVRTLLVGVLAGDDLRLSEIADLSCGLSAAFGPSASIELGTVNDEQTFSGRLSVVVLLFEEHATHTTPHVVNGLVVDERHVRGVLNCGNIRHLLSPPWEKVFRCCRRSRSLPAPAPPV